MAQALMVLQAVFEAGMTTGHEDEEWYVKTWRIHDPVTFDVQDMPIGVLIPDNENRVDQYVQEDTEVDTLSVHLFPKAAEYVTDIIAAQEQLVAMVDRATRVVRQDPTLGHRVYDAQVMGTSFRQPGFIDNSRVHSATMRVQLKQRVLWDSVR